MRDEDLCRFGTSKLKIGDIRVKGHPADVACCQSIAGFFPSLPIILRAKDAVCRPCKNHALASNDACNVLIYKSPQRFMPVVTVAFTDDDPTFSCKN